VHAPLPVALLACSLLLPGGVARADGEVESPQRIAAAARAAAVRETGRAESEIEVAPIDPRLRLAPCSDAPTARIAPGTRMPARLTVEVRCAAPAWRQFVAVQVRAQVPVLVAARPLGRLEVVAAADVAVVERDLAGLQAGYFSAPAEVAGRVAQRTIGAGEVLLPSSVRAPPLVRRGQTVTLIAAARGLTVRSTGTALADAALAERVQVRNAATARQVEGVVRSRSTVEVPLE
jgi:flagella basal body P-ring formation protein FlgA